MITIETIGAGGVGGLLAEPRLVALLSRGQFTAASVHWVQEITFSETARSLASAVVKPAPAPRKELEPHLPELPHRVLASAT